MDKNFINIDDLVRQRLGGGEEPERAGAWLQMRELLDEEMPQSRAGFIFWRRLFSAIAVLVLISSVSIGGYMYATSEKSTGANNNAIAGNTASDATAGNTTSSGNLTISVSSTPSNAPSTPSNVAEINSSKQISTVVASNHMNITANNSPSNKQKNEKATLIVKQTNKQILASNTTTPGNTPHNNKKHIAANDPKFLTQLIAANGPNKQQTRNGTSPIIAGANNTGNSKSVLSSGISQHNVKASKNNIQRSAKGLNGVGLAKAGITTGNNNHISNNNHHKNGVALSPNNSASTKTAGVVNTNKLALGSNTPAAKHTPSAKHINGVTSVIPANANTIPGSIMNGNTGTAKLNPDAKKHPGVSSKAALAAENNKNNSVAKKDAAPAELPKQTMVRLQLSEHLVISPTGETYYKLDTTSIETISEQLGLNSIRNASPAHNERNKPGMAAGVVAANAANIAVSSPGSPSGANTAASNTAGANTIGSNTSGNNTGAQPASNPTILPAASASANGQSGMGIKASQSSKMSGNASTVEKLSSTFNDIKFHVAGARFAAGLTAGINGTFFGPASFKGFQFGVTGNFIFGDNFSILTELKYFERINNDYTLNDNYYTYTPAGGGQYNKVLNSVPYSFSTLHSIELPVSIRYCKSHFNFYVGGNIVYTFAINTAAGTSAPTTTLVPATGNNSEPNIKQNDFDSRFGLGYLFGISYEISPSVMLDVRNVQTVWDNASTPGAKIISNQLYKSPSLQVSIGYRFGGNKDKSKDQ